MNTIQSQAAAVERGYFGYLPVALFGSVMGLADLSAVWRFVHVHFGAPLWIAQAIGCLAILAFVLQSAAYLTKLVTAFDKVKAEFNHPIAGNLFGTIWMSLLLLPFVLADYSLPLARAVWAVGAIGMTGFAWLIVSRWLHVRQNLAHATPAWIIPVVGMVDIPLAMPVLGLQYEHGIMIFALAVGLFFAVPLLTLIISRMMFEEPMPDAMLPSLLIMLAPFSVGFLAYVATTGHVDTFAEALYMLMLFMLAVLFGRLRTLAKCCPFRVSWWAVSFPLAASASAALRYADVNPNRVSEAIAMVLLAIASIVIAALVVRTVKGILDGELRALSN